MDAKTARFCLKLNLAIEDERKAGPMYERLTETCLGALSQSREAMCRRIEGIIPDENGHHRTLLAIRDAVCRRQAMVSSRGCEDFFRKAESVTKMRNAKRVVLDEHCMLDFDNARLLDFLPERFDRLRLRSSIHLDRVTGKLDTNIATLGKWGSKPPFPSRVCEKAMYHEVPVRGIGQPSRGEERLTFGDDDIVFLWLARCRDTKEFWKRLEAAV